MLAMVFLILPGAFGLALWNAYRTDRARERGGVGYTPRNGAVRWDDGGDSPG